LAAEKPLPQPKVIDVAEVQVDKGAIGKLFKQNAKLITEYFAKLSNQEVDDFEARLKAAQK
jgi:hypothetical protein